MVHVSMHLEDAVRDADPVEVTTSSKCARRKRED